MTDNDTDTTEDTPDGVEFSVDSHSFDAAELYQERRADPDPSSTDVDSADEVDPQRLHGGLTLTQLRWYWRETWAGTLVDKPVEDAFKHGWSIDHDTNGNPLENTLDYNDSNGIITADGNFESDYKLAQKKARRDGFALLYAVTVDDNNIYEPVGNLEEITRFRVLTVDQLTDTPPTNFGEQLPSGHDREDVVITNSGLVVSAKLGGESFGELLGVLWDNDLDIHSDDPVEENYQYRTREGANKFIHKDRFFHYAYRREVDGATNEDALGRFEGDSVLQRSIHTIKTILKANWAGGQALFRHSAPLHYLQPPEGISEDQWDDADNQMSNINSKSAFTLPPAKNGEGWELDALNASDVADPEPWYDALFNQVCAGQEMTKSVLFGTQSGTVSGSETDIKNYYNSVERLRESRFARDFNQFLTRLGSWDPSLAPNFALASMEVEWEPLFKLDKVKRAEAASRTIEAVTTGTANYLLSVEEARNILDKKWAELGIDARLDSMLSEDDMDLLDRTNTEYGKQFARGRQPENELERNESPMAGQNGGGREGRAASTPTSDSLTADVVDFHADAHFKAGTWVGTPRGLGVVTEKKAGNFSYPDRNTEGEKSFAGDSEVRYVVAHGGASGVYTDDQLSQVPNREAMQSDSTDDKFRFDGMPHAYVENDSLIDSGSFPDSWVEADAPAESILLQWWQSVGGTFSDAKETLQSDSDMNEGRAEEVAARYTTLVLGTDKWR